MRRLLFVMFFAALVFTTIFDYADAFSFKKIGFGGHITNTTNSDVTCTTGQGPVSLINAKKSDFLDYVIEENADNKTPKNEATEGVWILGLRETTSWEKCKLSTYPYPPYPVKPIKMYGASPGFNLKI